MKMWRLNIFCYQSTSITDVCDCTNYMTSLSHVENNAVRGRRQVSQHVGFLHNVFVPWEWRASPGEGSFGSICWFLSCSPCSQRLGGCSWTSWCRCMRFPSLESFPETLDETLTSSGLQVFVIIRLGRKHPVGDFCSSYIFFLTFCCQHPESR